MFVITLTKQQMFDQAAKGLKAQGWMQSRSEAASMCQYRGLDGMKCAIGHIIPNEACHEGAGVRGLVDLGYIYFKDIDHQIFAEYLQSAHDTGSYPELMVQEFVRLAIDNKLDPKEAY